MSTKYSVIVPAFNEEEVIMLSYKRLKDVMEPLGDYELIFVNDGSSDNTMSLLRAIAAENNRVKVISFSRNFGHQEAVSAGLMEVAGDAAVIIDADLQDPPEAIPEMAELWKKGADIVYGKRVRREGDGVIKKLTAWGFYRFLSLMGAQKVPKDTGDFRLIDKKVVKLLNSMPEKNRFLRGMSAWAGFNQVPYEFVRSPRAAGTTKYTLRKMLKLAGDGITAFSNRPLKLPFVLGCAVSFASFIYLIFSVIFTATGTWDIAHVLFAAVFLLIGFIFISLGTIGIYLGRIYDEAKERPVYIVSEKINCDD